MKIEVGKIQFTYNRKCAAHLDDTMVTVPDQIGNNEDFFAALEAIGHTDHTLWPRDAQVEFDTAGTAFPALLADGSAVIVRLDGDAYGLHAPGTGDMTVRLA